MENDAKIRFHKTIHITRLTETSGTSDGMGDGSTTYYDRHGGEIMYDSLPLPKLFVGLQRGGNTSTHYVDGTPKPKPKPTPAPQPTIHDIPTVTVELDPEYRIYAPGILTCNTNIDFGKADYLKIIKSRKIKSTEMQYAQLRVQNMGYNENELKLITVSMYYVPCMYVNHVSKWKPLKTANGGNNSRINTACKEKDYTHGVENFVLDLPGGIPLILIAHINNIDNTLSPIPTEDAVDADKLNDSPYWSFLKV